MANLVGHLTLTTANLADDAAFRAALTAAGNTVVETASFNATTATLSEGLDITNAAGRITFNLANAADTGTYNGVISETTAATNDVVTKDGDGTLILTGNSTFTGKITHNDGTLQITRSEALGANPDTEVTDNITVDGGTLEFNGTSVIELGNNKGITIGTNNAILKNINSSTYIAGKFAGTGTLNFEGTASTGQVSPRTFVLSGVSNTAHTGNILVERGASVIGAVANEALLFNDASKIWNVRGDLGGTGFFGGTGSSMNLTGGRLLPSWNEGNEFDFLGNITFANNTDGVSPKIYLAMYQDSIDSLHVSNLTFAEGTNVDVICTYYVQNPDTGTTTGVIESTNNPTGTGQFNFSFVAGRNDGPTQVATTTRTITSTNTPTNRWNVVVA